MVLTLLFATALGQPSVARKDHPGSKPTPAPAPHPPPHNAEEPHRRQCLPGERDAILKFEAATKHDPEKMLSTWVAGGDCCKSWKAVTSDRSTGHVTHLQLQLPGPAKHSNSSETETETENGHTLKGTLKPPTLLIPNSARTSFQPSRFCSGGASSDTGRGY